MNPLPHRRRRSCLSLVLMHMLLIALVAVVLVTSQPASSLKI